MMIRALLLQNLKQLILQPLHMVAFQEFDARIDGHHVLDGEATSGIAQLLELLLQDGQVAIEFGFKVEDAAENCVVGELGE